MKLFTITEIIESQRTSYTFNLDNVSIIIGNEKGIKIRQDKVDYDFVFGFTLRCPSFGFNTILDNSPVNNEHDFWLWFRTAEVI